MISALRQPVRFTWPLRIGLAAWGVVLLPVAALVAYLGIGTAAVLVDESPWFAPVSAVLVALVLMPLAGIAAALHAYATDNSMSARLAVALPSATAAGLGVIFLGSWLVDMAVGI